MLKKQPRSALLQLDTVNQLAIRAAGPRYTPGVKPGAPNIAIEYLVDAFDALALVDGWRDRMRQHAAAIAKENEHREVLINRLFRRRSATPSQLLLQVSELLVLKDPQLVRQGVFQLRRNCDRVVGRIRQESEKLWDLLRTLPEGPASNDERGRIQSDARVLDDLARTVEGLVDYLR